MRPVLAALLLGLFSAMAAFAAPICTLVVDADDGATLLAEGDCASRVTPASTFKIALAVIGFDAGVLKGPHDPVLPYRDGYVTWGGEVWRRDTDPTRWMQYSVVWYSQQLAKSLGAEVLTAYGHRLDYGNADFSGDPGQENGLMRSWLSSSLLIAPEEQAVFLRRLYRGDLPVSAAAQTQARALVERFDGGEGWHIQGKTGGAYPRRADRSFDRARGYGWFVGWAERGADRLIFVTLNQDTKPHDQSPGLRARAAFLQGWPARAAEALGRRAD